MHETFIATVLDAICDLDDALISRLEDHIRSMTGIQAESPLDLSFLPYSFSPLHHPS